MKTPAFNNLLAGPLIFNTNKFGIERDFKFTILKSSVCGHNIGLQNMNTFLARGNFFHLLITFANSLDPYQDRQNLDQNSLTHTLIVFLKEFFEKVNFE